MSTCAQPVHSWTGIEPINFRATNQMSNPYFFRNYPRTTCVPLPTTSFLNHGRSSRRILEVSGANNEGSQSSHYRSCRYLSPCSSGCLCRSCKHLISCSRHVWQDEVDTVKLSLRNDSGSAMEVKVGDKVMTLDPGKPVTLSLEVGTRIVANSNTPNHPAGSLIE